MTIAILETIQRLLLEINIVKRRTSVVIENALFKSASHLADLQSGLELIQAPWLHKRSPRRRQPSTKEQQAFALRADIDCVGQKALHIAPADRSAAGKGEIAIAENLITTEVIGNLGRNAATKTLAGGQLVTETSIAVNGPNDRCNRLQGQICAKRGNQMLAPYLERSMKAYDVSCAWYFHYPTAARITRPAPEFFALVRPSSGSSKHHIAATFRAARRP